MRKSDEKVMNLAQTPSDYFCSDELRFEADDAVLFLRVLSDELARKKDPMLEYQVGVINSCIMLIQKEFISND